MTLLSLVLMLAQGGAIATHPAGNLKQLEDASKGGDLAVVEQLLTLNPEWADARDASGVSYLFHAHMRRRTEVVEAFAKRRKVYDVFEASALGLTKDLSAIAREQPAAVNTLSGNGFRPLALAAFYSHPEAVALLVGAGADVNGYSVTARVQALHAAAASRCLECTRILLRAGADPNTPQEEGFRPLHEAALNNDRPLAELLIAHGALKEIKTDKGQTSIDVARHYGNHELAEWLASVPTRPGTARPEVKKREIGEGR